MRFFIFFLFRFAFDSIFSFSHIIPFFSLLLYALSFNNENRFHFSSVSSRWRVIVIIFENWLKCTYLQFLWRKYIFFPLFLFILYFVFFFSFLPHYYFNFFSVKIARHLNYASNRLLVKVYEMKKKKEFYRFSFFFTFFRIYFYFCFFFFLYFFICSEIKETQSTGNPILIKSSFLLPLLLWRTIITLCFSIIFSFSSSSSSSPSSYFF